MEKVRKFFKKLFYIVGQPYMRVLPGQLAFFTVLSLIPIVAIIGIIASYFKMPIGSITDVTQVIIPSEITNLAVNNIAGKGLTFNLVIFFITTFFLASNGSHSIIITSNEIYGIKGSAFFRRRLKAIVITLLLLLLILLVLAVPVFGNNIFDALKSELENTKSLEIISYFLKIIRIPLTMLIMFFGIKMIYRMAPDKKTSKIGANLGPLFTTIMWIISTEIYSIYVKHFAIYNLFYGSISNIIILMIWIYFISYIFVFGMAINATEEEDYKEMNS